MHYTQIIFYVLISSFTIQLLYTLIFYLGVSLHKNQSLNQSFGISIIVCCRNEKENLMRFLPKILAQNYQNYEVIIVVDRSWDNTVDYLNELKKIEHNLKIVNIPDNGSDHFGKKLAITLGIKAAKNEYLLFTDADCYPVNDMWLKEMSSGFRNKKEIVIGASNYIKEKGLVNKLIRFDTAQIAVNYLGFAKSGVPYMGVGRNLAYKRGIYEKARGFKSHYHIESGDDDLFINQVSDSKNTEVVFNANSITMSIAKKNWKLWLKQKKRHHTTNSLYKTSHKMLLIIGYLSTLFYYLSIFLLLLNWEYQSYVFTFFMIRTTLLTLIYYKPFKILLCKDLLLGIPIYEIILLFCQPLFQLNLNRNKK